MELSTLRPEQSAASAAFAPECMGVSQSRGPRDPSSVRGLSEGRSDPQGFQKVVLSILG